MSETIAHQVLDFWFGPRPLTPEASRSRNAIWFGGSSDVDYDIERRFGKLVSAARKGMFDSWSGDAESCLALILILDQFPRNLFRGQPAAFASDERALELTRALVTTGKLALLDPSERSFALMPYQHSESLEVQREGLAVYLQQVEEVPLEWQDLLRNTAEFAKTHLEIIEQFGRFPHRNKALGRDSTPEEIRYLNEGGRRFGQ